MEYTTNYHLPQWVETDRIMMGDFNDAMASIEEGLNSNAQAAEAAQAAAETQCKTGTYTGNGKTMAEGGNLIQTGFPPKFVIVSRGWTNTTRPTSYLALVGEKTVSGMEEYLTLTDTGFKIGVGSSSFVTLNESGQEYSYLAVR